MKFKKDIWVIIPIITALFIILPFIPLIFSSFSGSWQWPDITPNSLTLNNWRYIFSNQKSLEALFNTLIIAGGANIINIIIGIPAANILSRRDFKGKGIIEGLIFAPIVIPPFISIMGIHYNFIKLNLTDNIFGVILIHTVVSLPYAIRAMMVSFRTMNYDLESAAKVFGANRLERYRYIIVPHILPGIIAAISLTILVSMAQYLTTLIIGGGEVITLTLLIFPFLSGGDIRIGSSYVIFFGIINLIAIILMEYILKSYYKNN